MIAEFERINGKPCACGREHFVPLKVYSGKGAVEELIGAVRGYGAKKVFLLFDKTTFRVAGERVEKMLSAASISVLGCVLPESPEPDEMSVGYAVMCFDADCDAVVAVGSGVVNDTAKIVAAAANKPYMIVATAPSMDGYASATSSMVRSGLKITLKSKCPDVIIGDTDILATAPDKMLTAGLGDMLAKYVSICEWRISNVINGEYYCENIAALVRASLKKCIDNKEGLLKREDAAIEAVFEGLVVCGAAMAFAGISRPASGGEHYMSHIWDMRGLAFGEPVSLHGIQCALGTYICAGLYDNIRKITPDREKALAYVKNFDYAKYTGSLRAFLGKSAEAMIELEKKEKKYDVALHAKRLEVIISNWDKIQAIIDEELPHADEIKSILDTIGAPSSMAEIGLGDDILPMTFFASKDMRDKYVLSRLCFDLGIIEDMI